MTELEIGSTVGAFTVSEVLDDGTVLAHEDDGAAVLTALSPASTLQALTHPNIARGLHRVPGTDYSVHRPLSGVTLQQALEHRPDGLPVHDVAGICTYVARALDFAYANNVCHGDLSPARVLVTARGTMVVTGWGSDAPAHYGVDNDIAAMGRLAGELLTGTVPGDDESWARRRPDLPSALVAVIGAAAVEAGWDRDGGSARALARRICAALTADDDTELGATTTDGEPEDDESTDREPTAGDSTDIDPSSSAASTSDDSESPENGRDDNGSDESHADQSAEKSNDADTSAVEAPTDRTATPQRTDSATEASSADDAADRSVWWILAVAALVVLAIGAVVVVTR